MNKLLYPVSVFFLSLLLSTGMGYVVNAQTITQSRSNWSTGGSGFSAYRGSIMEYRITVTNNTSSN
ncbi:MAG TPA: hypothetical protein VGE79_04635, partial [Niastella sp.]